MATQPVSGKMEKPREFNVARLISVHDEPEPIRFVVSNVHPGEYRIPGVFVPDGKSEKDVAADIAAVSVIHVRPIGVQQPIRFQYAERRKDYVLIQVAEANSPIQLAAVKQMDEWDQPMNPPVARMMHPIRAAEIQHQIENDYGRMGIVAIAGDEPTATELAEAYRRNDAFKISVVTETNKAFRAFGERGVTPQARRIAWNLHTHNKLNPLPEWAMVNPEGTLSINTFHCGGCGKVLAKDAVRCTGCLAIYNWPKAVDLGMVKMADVPPSHRKACGLPPLVDETSGKKHTMAAGEPKESKAEKASAA